MRLLWLPKLSALVLLAVLPFYIWSASPQMSRSTLNYWIATTPRCFGPICINVFSKEIEIDWNWP